MKKRAKHLWPGKRFLCPRHWSLEQRLAYYTDKTGPSGCWVWRGGRDKDGYGSVRRPGHSHQRAHRAAWIIAYGAIPAGLFVLHRCDTPPCVNPAHLWLGTNAENMADMVAKGRHVILRGVENSQAVLSEAEVRLIRKDVRRGRDVAASFGVSESLISQIRARLLWGHI